MEHRTIKEIQVELDALNKKANTYDRIANEGGDGHNAFLDRMQALFRELKAAEEFQFAQTWTKEETEIRKTAWNSLVQKTAESGRNVPLNVLEDKIGFTYFDLKKAITMYPKTVNA